MRKILYYAFAVVLAVALNTAVLSTLYFSSSQKQQKAFDAKITTIQKQVSGLQDKLETVSGEKVAVAPPAAEVVQREVIREKSQDQQLTEAVAKAAPAVVSIVISKDVPQLEVTYQNPFGNDPFYQDFGIQVPVYRQKGTVRQKVGAGTGFLITSDGYILTNRHVVADTQASYTVLLSDGRQLDAQVVYRDANQDAAVVKINAKNLPTVNLGDSSGLQLGQAVIAIGNALGEYNNSVSTGIVSGLNRKIEATTADGSLEAINGVIQTDAAINPGNSGGPLLTLDGKVIGVNVATVTGSSNISFSIPINFVKSIINSVTGKNF
ncbi:MAG: trypsin-like peptidase domain-containing protein [Patescibacteria group bacterium]|nr:trypsin-like peptidase domain-containing protein [Patescibacteria group bacterium]